MLSLDERVGFGGRKGSSGGRNRHPRGWTSTFTGENGHPSAWTSTFRRENGHPRPWMSTMKRESGHPRATKVKSKKERCNTSTSVLARMNIYGNFPQHP